MADQTEVEREPKTELDRRWAAYQEHVQKFPGDANSWRAFYAGCEAGYEAGARDMRERAAKALAWSMGGDDGVIRRKEAMAAVRSLPLTEGK